MNLVINGKSCTVADGLPALSSFAAAVFLWRLHGPNRRQAGGQLSHARQGRARQASNNRGRNRY